MSLAEINGLFIAITKNANNATRAIQRTGETAEQMALRLERQATAAERLASAGGLTARGGTSITVADSIPAEKRDAITFGGQMGIELTYVAVQAIAAEVERAAEAADETQTVTTELVKSIPQVMLQGFRDGTASVAASLMPGIAQVMLEGFRSGTPSIVAEVRRVITEAAPPVGKTAAPLPEKCGGGFSPNVMRWSGGLR